MTPRFSTLKIHEQEGSEAVLGPRPLGKAGALAPTRPRFRVIEGLVDSAPSSQRRQALHRRLLGAADVIASTVALAAVLAVPGGAQLGVVLIAGMPLVVLPFKVAGLYDRDQMRLVHSTLDEVPLLLQLSGLYALSVTILAPLALDGRLRTGEIAALWLLTFGMTVTARVAARSAAARTSRPERCLVIGEVDQADRIRQKLVSSRSHARVVATLPLVGRRVESLGGLEGVRRMVAHVGAHRIIIAPTTTDPNGVAELIRIAKATGAQVSVLPRLLEAAGSAVEFEDIDGMSMLGLRPFGLSRSSRLLKRGLDIAAASIGLVAVAPVLAGVALAIRLESRGPVFFRQVRVGRDGRHFRIFKFRSMCIDAESQKEHLRSLNEVGDGMFKISEDPRVTRVGRFLRRTSLDELPQIFNVLRGEMSLVGPRPLVIDEDELVQGLDRSRLHLTPGMTGPWQVLGVRVPMAEMIAIDYLYVAGWSLWLDVKLLMRTARHVLRRGNV
ncbi:MAG: exopolysaccharide biosynthesis polyprenyl glycosylphosphotransferase [Actinomycetota bacterium]|nr:exopolysaccharide biosynthesis polyprenyl glycosylphosphotransferase [Actinomycetota bacterium]